MEPKPGYGNPLADPPRGFGKRQCGHRHDQPRRAGDQEGGVPGEPSIERRPQTQAERRAGRNGEEIGRKHPRPSAPWEQVHDQRQGDHVDAHAADSDQEAGRLKLIEGRGHSGDDGRQARQRDRQGEQSRTSHAVGEEAERRGPEGRGDPRQGFQPAGLLVHHVEFPADRLDQGGEQPAVERAQRQSQEQEPERSPGPPRRRARLAQRVSLRGRDRRPLPPGARFVARLTHELRSPGPVARPFRSGSAGPGQRRSYASDAGASRGRRRWPRERPQPPPSRTSSGLRASAAA